jgi:hypothetical protein
MLGRMRLRASTSFFLPALTGFPINAKVLRVDVASRTAWCDTRRRWMIWCSNAGYCRKIQLIHRGDQEWIEATK